MICDDGVDFDGGIDCLSASRILLLCKVYKIFVLLYYLYKLSF